VDALARQGLSTPFLGPELVVAISLCISRLKERHCEHLAAAPGIKQLKLLFERYQINCLGTY
jgi:hypothetical protein